MKVPESFEVRSEGIRHGDLDAGCSVTLPALGSNSSWTVAELKRLVFIKELKTRLVDEEFCGDAYRRMIELPSDWPYQRANETLAVGITWGNPNVPGKHTHVWLNGSYCWIDHGNGYENTPSWKFW